MFDVLNYSLPSGIVRFFILQLNTILEGTSRRPNLQSNHIMITCCRNPHKEPAYLGESLLKVLICCLHNPFISDGKRWGICEFDKDMHKLYIYNSCIFSYHLFYFLGDFCQNVILHIKYYSLKVLLSYINLPIALRGFKKQCVP